MSPHWRLALAFAACAVVLSMLASLGVLYWYGAAYAAALLYGALVGTVSFVSTALTVTLLMGRTKAAGVMIGGATFIARFGFAAGALGVPAYLGLWPVVTMMAGFAAVYLAENALLVPVLLGKKSGGFGAGYPVDEGVERRAKV